jgi:3-hydroxybutyryl-CoA dehydrogenase
MKLGMNHPMGPVHARDFIGLDTCVAILEVMHDGPRRSEVPAVPAAPKYVAAAGSVGRPGAASTRTAEPDVFD